MTAKHGRHPILVLHARAERVGGLPLRPKGLSTDCLTARGGCILSWVMAFRRPYLCPKIRSKSKTVPLRFITEEGWRIILAGMKIGETAHRQSERQKIDLAGEQDQCGEERSKTSVARSEGKTERFKNFSRVNIICTILKLSCTQ